jgi:hypothetical protein
MKELTKEQTQRVFELWANPDFMATVPPVDGATFLVRELARRGWEVNVLTARNQEQHIIDYCKLHFPEVKDVIFCHHAQKTQWLKDADLFVDDCAQNLVDAAEATNVRHIVAPFHMHNRYTYIDLLTMSSVPVGIHPHTFTSGDGTNQIFTRSLTDIIELIDQQA